MDFLWTKQAAILDNISNAETPNYKVKTVTFEESFQQAIEAADRDRQGSGVQPAMRKAIESVSWDVMEPEEVVRMDDNGVNVTEQSMEAVRNAYQLQYVYQSISSDINALRTAING
nr:MULTISPECIES: flagellar biosynthesis protein FlgB [unclassified Neglectibacter]